MKKHPHKGHLHTEDFKKMMSEKKKQWWKTHDTTKTRKKIGIASKKFHAKVKWLGPTHPAWRGGRFVQKRDGYVYIYAPDHPFAKRNSSGGGGYYLEHRLVMEKHLGRILTQNEEVHHKNGIHGDNRLSNLELMVKQQHFGKAKCPYCGNRFKVK